MSKQLSPDNLVRVLAALLLGLLTYQAKCLCDRVERLESTQNRICVRLGIDPVAGESLPNWGSSGTAAAAEKNPGNQNLAESQNNYEIFP